MPVFAMNDVKALNDRFGRFLVRVECKGCGAVREFTNEQMVDLAGGRRDTTLAELEKRLCCRVCQLRVAKVIAVSEPRPRGRGMR